MAWEDREMCFDTFIKAAVGAAENRWKNGESFNSLVCGFGEDRQGIQWAMNFSPGQEKDYYSWLYKEFIENKIRIAAIIQEMWALERKHEEAQDTEVDGYLNDGGSLEFWPGSQEILKVEVADQFHFSSAMYEIEREDGIYVSKKKIKKGTINYQPFPLPDGKSTVLSLLLDF